MKNNAKYTIYGVGSVKLFDCSVDFVKSSSAGATGTVAFESVPINSYANIIPCYETIDCHAKYDAIEGVSNKTIDDEYYTKLKTKRRFLLNTINNANNKVVIKQETESAVKNAFLISALPYDVKSRLLNI